MAPSARELAPRLLRPFGRVRPAEVATVALLAANVFLLLLGYYLLKTIREPLILGVAGGGAEVKRYAGGCEAFILMGASLAFGKLAERVNRIWLITIVTLFFAGNLVCFYLANVALPTHRLELGIAFFIWLGCFDMMIVAQFWSFANDLYSREEGERVFPLVAAGASLGALMGAVVAKRLLHWFSPFPMMLIVSVLLCATLPLAWVIHRRESLRAARSGQDEIQERPVAATSGVRLLLRSRYLMLVAALSLGKNWVNTAGEYLLDRRLLERAQHQFGNGTAQLQGFIGAFKSDYFIYFNVIVLVCQLFAVPQILHHLGVRRALFIAPVVALGCYSTMFLVPLLSVIFVGKVVENSVDYSVQKTTEQTLFLVTSREAKYKVKPIVDTFLVRLGDVCSALVVWFATRIGWVTRDLILVNIVMTILWLGLVVLLARAHARSEREKSRWHGLRTAFDHRPGVPT